MIMLDEYQLPGGQFFKQAPKSFDLEDGAILLKDYSRGQRLIRLVTESEIEIWEDSFVWGVFPDLILAVKRGKDSLALRAAKVIVAGGAFERPVPFPGWTLPGVLSAGSAQTLVKSQEVLPGTRALLVRTGPLQLPVAHQLIQGGAQVVAIAEGATLGQLAKASFACRNHLNKLLEGLGYWRGIRKSGTKFIFGHTIVKALGKDHVEAAVIAAIDRDWRIIPGTERELEVDLICPAFGFLPSTQMTRLFKCAEQFDAPRGGYLPIRDQFMETSTPGVFAVGDCAGIGGSELAMAQGRLAALAAARQLDLLDESGALARISQARADLYKQQRFADFVIRTFTPQSALFGKSPDDTIVSRCEEITAGEIREAVANGANSL